MQIVKIIIVYDLPHLSSSCQLAHKAFMHRFHMLPSLAAVIAGAQQFHPSYNLSCSVLLLHAVCDRSTFLLPSECHVIAVTCSPSLIHDHSRFFSECNYFAHSCCICSLVEFFIWDFVRPSYSLDFSQTSFLEGFDLFLVLFCCFPRFASIQLNWQDQAFE